MARPLGSFSFVLALVVSIVASGRAAELPHRAASVVAQAAQDDAKAAGTIEGQVVAIDYGGSTMSVESGGKTIDVTILPSTNIEGGGNDFHSIADIKKGQKLRVLLSKRGSMYSAQIITLL